MLSGIKAESEITGRFLLFTVNGFETGCHYYSISCFTKTYTAPNRPGGGRMYPWLPLMKWALLLLLGTQTWESELLANEPYNEALETSSLDSIAFSAYQLTDVDCQSAAWQNRVCRLQCSSQVCWLWHIKFSVVLKRCEALWDKEPLSISNGDSSFPDFPPSSHVSAVSHTSVSNRQRWDKLVFQVT